jgi:hypothetical protein
MIFSRIFVFLKMSFINAALPQSLGTSTIIEISPGRKGGVSVH